MKVYILYITSCPEAWVPNILGSFEFCNDAIEMLISTVQENSNVGWGVTPRMDIIENINIVTYKNDEKKYYEYEYENIRYRIDETNHYPQSTK